MTTVPLPLPPPLPQQQPSIAASAVDAPAGQAPSLSPAAAEGGGLSPDAQIQAAAQGPPHLGHLRIKYIPFSSNWPGEEIERTSS
jgi:hypothetical protein